MEPEGEVMYPTRTLPDGRALTAMPLLFGRGRVGISATSDNSTFTDVW
jgi:hypothetical protein